MKHPTQQLMELNDYRSQLHVLKTGHKFDNCVIVSLECISDGKETVDCFGTSNCNFVVDVRMGIIFLTPY